MGHVLDAFTSALIGTAGLSLIACVALFLAWSRRPQTAHPDAERRTIGLFVVGIFLQCAHFAEEYATGFYRLFPTALGLTPWSARFFIAFNLTWLGIWAWAAFAVRTRSRAAYSAIWFFALAAVLNGVAHPLLAIRAGGYFPGLLTAPLLGVVGGWLFVRLLDITDGTPKGGHDRQPPLT